MSLQGQNGIIRADTEGEKAMKELEIISHPQIEGLSLFFDTVDYRTPHFHPEWELIWLKQGELSLRCGGQTYCAGKGQLLLFSPKESHEFHAKGEGCTFLCVQVTPAMLGLPESLRVASPKVDLFLSQPELAQVQEEILRAAEAYFRRQDCYEPLCIGRIALVFHRLLSRMPCRRLSPAEAASADRRNRRMLALQRFVDENYMHKILLSDFARQEGCSLSHLSRFVKETLNQSFQEYVGAVRLNAACRRIAEGETGMLEICLESGFSDYRYFSRAFKRQFGLTPEQYSRQERRPEPDGSRLHRSIHSLERFYNREQSLRLLERMGE